MTDEDREALKAFVEEIDALEQKLIDTRSARNAFMNELFNSYRADIDDIRHVTGMKRPYVATLVRGPRTRHYRLKQRNDREGT